MAARKRKVKSVSKKKKEFVFSWKVFLFLVVLGVFLGFLAYSVFVYNKSEAESEGVTVCNPQTGICDAAFHWHAQLDIEVCGKEVFMPLEEDDLSEAHTHKERNRIHWHDTVPYDKNTGTILDTGEFKLGAFFDEMKYRFEPNCIGEKCNGFDVCGDGRENSLKMFVNGEQNFEFRDYVWKDGDEIKIVFE